MVGLAPVQAPGPDGDGKAAGRNPEPRSGRTLRNFIPSL